MADEAQSAPLRGWVGSQEGPTDNVHTCTTAEMELVRLPQEWASRRPEVPREATRALRLERVADVDRLRRRF